MSCIFKSALAILLIRKRIVVKSYRKLVKQQLMILNFFYHSGIPLNDILETFGNHFYKYCKQSGYDRILKILGRTLREFLCNLDALHDHLASIYPGMNAPSFRASERPDGGLDLHYYSNSCLLYTSPSPRDATLSRMPSSA